MAPAGTLATRGPAPGARPRPIGFRAAARPLLVQPLLTTSPFGLRFQLVFLLTWGLGGRRIGARPRLRTGSVHLSKPTRGGTHMLIRNPIVFAAILLSVLAIASPGLADTGYTVTLNAAQEVPVDASAAI